MVTFSRTPTSTIRAAHRDARADRIAASPADPPPKNIRTLIQMGANRVMLYRSHTVLIVPPVPALVGLEVWDLTQKLLREENVKERAPMLERLIAVATSCVRPITRRGQLLRLLGLWRPFRDISEGELRGVADFLLRCRQSAGIHAF